MRQLIGRILLLLLFWSLADSSGRAELPRVEPADVGMDAARLGGIDVLIDAALKEGKMPGCVVCIGRRGRVCWLKAYGLRQVEPDEQPMTIDTVFDLASLTKPVATATSVMVLVDRGDLKVDQTVSSVIPEFAVNGKEEVTIHDLLIHQSGLIADNPLSDYDQGAETSLQHVFDLHLQNPRGSKFVYSDVNFIVLGEVVRRVSGARLDEFSVQRIFDPLGMQETCFCPGERLRSRAAPTERRDGEWIRGAVHDPRAFRLGGVAGHAGLFSTASDLAVYAQMMVSRGRYGEHRIMSEDSWSAMTRGYKVSSGIRGLGWDKRTGYSSNRGAGMSDAAFGHGGFTGTAIWIDPELDLFVIFLSNRVHPNGKGLVNPLAGKIGTVAVEAIIDRRPE